MHRRALRNFQVRRYGSGIPEDMTRAQLGDRCALLRWLGRGAEAAKLAQVWLATPKEHMR